MERILCEAEEWVQLLVVAEVCAVSTLTFAMVKPCVGVMAPKVRDLIKFLLSQMRRPTHAGVWSFWHSQVGRPLCQPLTERNGLHIHDWIVPRPGNAVICINVLRFDLTTKEALKTFDGVRCRLRRYRVRVQPLSKTILDDSSILMFVTARIFFVENCVVSRTTIGVKALAIRFWLVGICWWILYMVQQI